MKKSLKDATADLKANTEAEPEMTQEEINVYRDVLDIQRIETDLVNNNTFLALDVVRTLQGLVATSAANIYGQEDEVIVSLKKVAADKITEAIGHIKFITEPEEEK